LDGQASKTAKGLRKGLFNNIRVDIKPLIGAMDADAAAVTGQRRVRRSDALGAFGAEGGMGHEVLQFDVALGVEQPVSVGGDFRGAQAGTNLQGGHRSDSFHFGLVAVPSAR